MVCVMSMCVLCECKHMCDRACIVYVLECVYVCVSRVHASVCVCM